MPTVTIEGGQLVVALSAWERFVALRGPVTVPVSSVSSVVFEPDPWQALRGIRAPGTGFPRTIAYGVWRWTGEGRDFVAVLGRRPAVRIDLTPDALFSRLLLTVPDPQATIAAIESQLG